ncbi:MAG TPA: hypothetical protein ENK43_06220 [Planctomycetes bacterium]|nr:hypothetical protein [Planctomycetota bacterium]
MRLIIPSFLFLVAACATYDAPCPSVLPEAAEAPLDTTAFETSFQALKTAIQATPQWETRASSRAWVRGEAELVLERIEELYRWVPRDEISCGAIALARFHVRRLAGMEPSLPSPANASLVRSAEAELQRVADERAFHDTWTMLPWLEDYVNRGIAFPWLEREVLPSAKLCLERVQAILPADTEAWTVQRIPSSLLEDTKTRAAHVLERLP